MSTLKLLHTWAMSFWTWIRTVLLGWPDFEFFRVLYFSLGAAVLDSEFRADPESGLRIEQSPAGHIESSVLKISSHVLKMYGQAIMYLKCMVRQFAAS